ncbi:sigma-70 family RNA polymerase sigma factor [Streptomyces lycii]|uniref:RNA polymerase sigma factor n=1 Tax=Streptomyces lycii TaxID=2654337 RepID=A0ABQ7FHF8_9ACTN|nr:sigma-70 family RNA polymerase sigma factor [Streptomyces lycii]KAF4408085.1 sigma-70 family RNA polymerase sigma factor [Streptomyces lycii]
MAPTAPRPVAPTASQPSAPTASRPSARKTAGPEEFLRVVHATQGRHLLQYAKTFTSGDEQRAEDIVQEAMLRAWRHVEKLRETPEMVRPWLFTVVRRLAVDSHRARQSRPAESGPDVLERVAVPDPADSTLDSRVMRGALAELTDQHREVLLHRYYLDRSVQRTAAVLNIAEGTVKSRSSHALRSLRRVLEAQGAAPAGAGAA